MPCQYTNFDILKFNLTQYNRPQHEALGNKPHKPCSYSQEPRAEVYSVRRSLLLFIIISKLVYSTDIVLKINLQICEENHNFLS